MKSPKEYSDEIGKYFASDIPVPEDLKEGLIKSLIKEYESGKKENKEENVHPFAD